VEYYSNGLKLGEATNCLTLISVSNVPLGSYSLRGGDGQHGLRGTSGPVSYNVVTNLPLTLVRGRICRWVADGAVVRSRTTCSTVVNYGSDPTSLTNAVEMKTNEQYRGDQRAASGHAIFLFDGSSIQRVAGTNGRARITGLNLAGGARASRCGYGSSGTRHGGQRVAGPPTEHARRLPTYAATNGRRTCF
jgi:hypothetical protein